MHNSSAITPSRGLVRCILACVIALFLCPAPSLAQEPPADDADPIEQPVVSEVPTDVPGDRGVTSDDRPSDAGEYGEPDEQAVVAGDLVAGDEADNDALLDAYAERCLREQLPSERVMQVQSPRVEHLKDLDLAAYTFLRQQAGRVAAGQRTSTVFEVALPAFQEGTPNLRAIISELLATCPYELYWYDKTADTRLKRKGTTYTFSFPVAEGYRGSGTYEVDPSCGTRVRSAAAQAKQIVGAHAGEQSYDQLLGYVRAICELVSYDYSAAQAEVAYGDPWQLVSVFDGDPSTNVVCEGYAKALQYLCDLTGFSGVYCYTVTGTMRLAGSPERHMWNVVSVADGSNYLVDVTNCDGAGAHALDLFFMRSRTSGSLGAGYTFAMGSYSATYSYDEDTRNLYEDHELALSATPYSADRGFGSLEKASVADVFPKAYTGSALRQRPVVMLYGGALKEGTDYVLSYANNVNVGTATLTITGAGAYRGTITRTFRITRAANPLKAKARKKVVKVKAARVRTRARTLARNVKVTGAKGALSYENASKSKAAKRFKVGRKTGKVRVPKGTMKGTYTIRIKVTAAGTASYKARSRTVSFKVKVA